MVYLWNLKAFLNYSLISRTTIWVILMNWFCIIFRNNLLLTRSWSPESLRWMLVKGKMEEAEQLYRKIARINGKELPEKSLEIDPIEVTQTRLGNSRDLFKTRQQIDLLSTVWLHSSVGQSTAPASQRSWVRIPLSHLNFSGSWDNCLNCPASARIISSFENFRLMYWLSNDFKDFRSGK